MGQIQMAAISAFKKVKSILYVLQCLVKFCTKKMIVRKLLKTVLSVEQAEGVGARVRRSIGRKEVSSSNIDQLYTSRVTLMNIPYVFYLKLSNLDPFLMLDEFKVVKPAGFPDHPHRGFETVRRRNKEFILASFEN